MRETIARRAALIWFLALALWTAAGLRAFLPVSRSAFAMAHVNLGEGLLHATTRMDVSDRMPMEPIFEALCVVHAGPIGREAVVAAVLVATLLLVFALGGVLGSLWCGLIVATIWEKHLWSLTINSGYYKYFFFTSFILTVVGAMILRARKPSAAKTLLLACAIGASLLYRSTLAFFPPFLVLYELLFARRSTPAKYWRQSLLLLAVPYLFLLPWARMNWEVFHRFTPFESDVPNLNMALGTLGVVQGGDGDATMLIGVPPNGAPRSLLAWSVREISRHPLRYSEGGLKRLLLVFRIFPVWAVFAAFALFSFRKREEFRQVGVFLFYFIAIHCLMAVTADYFEPLRPILIALTASWLLSPWTRMKEENESASRGFSRAIVFAAAAAAALLGFLTIGAVDSYARRARAVPLGSAAALERELARSPNDGWLLFDRGGRRLNAGDLVGAERDLGRAAASLPGVPRIQLLLDWALAIKGRPEALMSEPYCGTITAPLSDQVQETTCIYQALAERRLDRDDESRRLMQKALDLRRGEQKLLSASTPAEKAVQETLRGSSDAYFLGSLDYLSPPDRFIVLNEITRLHPEADGAILWEDLAHSSLDAGDVELALKAMDRAEVLGLSADETSRRRQNIYSLMTPQSLSALCAKRPGDFDLWLARAEVDMNAGRLGEAAAAAARAELLARGRPGRGPRLTSLQRRLAFNEQRTGRFAAALGRLRRLIVAIPDDASLFNDLGVCEYLSGDPRKAAKSLEIAIRRDPALLSAYVSLAFVDESLERFDEARRVDDLALAVKTNDAALHEMIRKDRAALDGKGRGLP